MSDKLPIIHGEIYESEADMLDLAKKFFYDEENDEVSISTLKPSLFGYFSEAGANIMKYGVYHRNVFYDEYFLNTAAMDSSIHNFAKLYNFEIDNATPSTVTTTIAMKESDIISYGMTNPSDPSGKIFKLDKQSTFMFEDFVFMPTNSLIITAKKFDSSGINDSWSFSAQYDLLDYNLSEYSDDNPYIKTWRSVIDRENWFIIQLNLRNMTRTEYEYEIFDSDTSIPISYPISYDQLLAGFSVYTKDPGESVYTELEHGEFNASSPPVDIEEYFYYSYPSDTMVDIYFGTSPDYRPKFGSSVKIVLYTTKGTEGNFSYTGGVSAKLKTDEYDLKSGYTDHSSLKSIIAKNTTQAAGGMNRLTILQVKEELIKKILVRENLITPTDLDYFFSAIIQSTSVNGGTIQFYKQRDDILRRMYTAFILLRDGNNRIIPTNTVDILLDFPTIEDRNFVFKPGEIVVYDEEIKIHRLLREDEYPESFLDNKYSFVYSMPYLTYVKLDPFPRIIYYRTSINEDRALAFTMSPTFLWESLINSVSIKRSGLFNRFYDLTLTMFTNIETTGKAVDGISARADYIKIRFILKDSNGLILCCFDMGRNTDKEGEWNAKLSTNDEIDDSGNIILTENAVGGPIMDAEGNVISKIAIPENITIEVAILYDALSSEGISSAYNLAIQSREDNPTYYNMLDLGETNITPYYYGVAATFKLDGDTDLSFHKSLTEYNYSDLVINSDASVIIRNMAVIGTKYISDPDTVEEVDRILRIYEDVLVDSFFKLEDNTQFNVKFMNTYGISKHFAIDTVNLFIPLKIKLTTGYSPTIEKEIKTAISNHVQDSNTSGKLALSNIVSMLERDFTEILYVTISGMNRLGLQQFERTVSTDIETLNKSQVMSYVPEFLNINLELQGDDLEYSIKIDFI